MQHSLEHWFGDKQSRLLAWREWRQQLVQLPQEQLISMVATWWKFVPMVNKTFDPWRTETWPNPWELIGAGEFCANAQGLGIFYTLSLLGVDCELVFAQLMDQKETRLMVLTADKKLLNYVDGEVVDIDQATLQMLKIWQPSDLARLVKV